MSRLWWRLGVPVALLASAIGAYEVLALGGESAPATATPSPPQQADAPPTRETPYGGVVARLPFVGTLTWRCDDERRFFTQLTLPSPGATVLVGLEADGTRVWRRRPVHPRPPPRRAVAGPFAAVRDQTWTIRYHHMPATLTVIARLRFAAPRSRSDCVVSRTNIQVRRTPH
jgi:hypothetical protein